MEYTEQQRCNRRRKEPVPLSPCKGLGPVTYTSTKQEQDHYSRRDLLDLMAVAGVRFHCNLLLFLLVSEGLLGRLLLKPPHALLVLDRLLAFLLFLRGFFLWVAAAHTNQPTPGRSSVNAMLPPISLQVTHRINEYKKEKHAYPVSRHAFVQGLFFVRIFPCI